MIKSYTTPPRKAAPNSETQGEMQGPPEFRMDDYMINNLGELINKRTGQEATPAEERVYRSVRKSQKK